MGPSISVGWIAGTREGSGGLAAWQAGVVSQIVLPWDGARDYVDSMWERQADPCAGEVVNSYDGGPEPGKPAQGGFYDRKTSSPAAALAPAASFTPVHCTLHVAGERVEPEAIACWVLVRGLP